MPLPFLKTDLLISQTRIDQITSALANSAQPDPIAVIITEEQRKVDTWRGQHDLDDDSYKRLMRALVMYKLFATGSIGPMPEEVKGAYEDAMDELSDIRDGKLQLVTDTTPPSGVDVPAAKQGGATKVKARSDA